MNCKVCGHEISEPDGVISELPTIKEKVSEVLDSIATLFERNGAISGFSTGFKDLDRYIDGLHGADMIVIVARPLAGKTAFAMTIADHVAIEQQKAVAIFSLDMSSHLMVQNLICSRAKVSLGIVRDGLISERKIQALAEEAERVAKSPIYIDDTPGISIHELSAKARRLKALHNIELIVIDPLQSLRSTSRRAERNRHLELSEISAGIKALAKELSIPIIVMAKLHRRRKRPLLSDIYESTNAQYDADVIGFLTREEFYAQTEQELLEANGKARLLIVQQRNGPTGYLPLRFVREFFRFEDTP